jgi:hypothetical protein
MQVTTKAKQNKTRHNTTTEEMDKMKIVYEEITKSDDQVYKQENSTSAKCGLATH